MSTGPSRAVFPALGTTAVVLVSDPAATAAARATVEAEIAALDRACSRFRLDSELSALNAAAGTAVSVSPLLLDAIEVALRAARITAGRVVPTVGEAMRVLGYDRTFADVARDGAPVRARVGSVPGWQLVTVDRLRGRVQFPAGVELDLGATAKALGADRAAAAAYRATGSGVLVSLGGDIATAGPTPAEGWTVLIADDHAAPLEGAGDSVTIRSGGLATSGTAVRRWTRGGRELHHVIDPATGLPAETVWRTVSVAAATCVDANIASTASIILGGDAPSWLRQRGLPARLVGLDGRVTVVGGWPAREEQPC